MIISQDNVAPANLGAKPFNSSSQLVPPFKTLKPFNRCALFKSLSGGLIESLVSMHVGYVVSV
jgi:hypothetical protein